MYDDGAEDELKLNKFRGEKTVYEGHLEKEGARVTVVNPHASDPDDMEVKMVSDYSY